MGCTFSCYPLKRLHKGSKQEEEEDSDGGFRRRPKLRTTIALDQRYTWAAPSSCQESVSKAYFVNAGHRLPNSFAPDPLIVSQSSFLDRYPRDPALHFVPRHAIPLPCQFQQQQQYHPIHQHQLQQQIPASQISDNVYLTEQVNGYPNGAGIHQIPIYPHQILCKRPTDVSKSVSAALFYPFPPSSSQRSACFSQPFPAQGS